MTGHCSEPGWYFREIRKRIRTLLVPYCFWNVACFFFYAIIAMIVSGRVVWIRDCLGINPFGLPEMPRLWFVRGLIVCVLLSPVLWKIANVGWMGIGLMYAVYVILCPGPEGAGVLHSLFRKGMFPLAMLFYFTMGMRFREKTFDLSVSPVNGVMCLTIGLVLIAAQAFCRYVCWGWAQYFGCLAIPLLMIGIWAVIPNSKWPDWLTRCAFPIYLVHGLGFFLFNNLFLGIPIGCCGFYEPRTMLQTVASAFFAFLVSIAIGLFFRCLPGVARVVFGGR